MWVPQIRLIFLYFASVATCVSRYEYGRASIVVTMQVSEEKLVAAIIFFYVGLCMLLNA